MALTRDTGASHSSKCALGGFIDVTCLKLLRSEEAEAFVAGIARARAYDSNDGRKHSGNDDIIFD